MLTPYCAHHYWRYWLNGMVPLHTLLRNADPSVVLGPSGISV